MSASYLSAVYCAYTSLQRPEFYRTACLFIFSPSPILPPPPPPIAHTLIFRVFNGTVGLTFSPSGGAVILHMIKKHYFRAINSFTSDCGR